MLEATRAWVRRYTGWVVVVVVVCCGGTAAPVRADSWLDDPSPLSTGHIRPCALGPWSGRLVTARQESCGATGFCSIDERTDLQTAGGGSVLFSFMRSSALVEDPALAPTRHECRGAELWLEPDGGAPLALVLDAAHRHLSPSPRLIRRVDDLVRMGPRANEADVTKVGASLDLLMDGQSRYVPGTIPLVQKLELLLGQVALSRGAWSAARGHVLTAQCVDEGSGCAPLAPDLAAHAERLLAEVRRVERRTYPLVVVSARRIGVLPSGLALSPPPAPMADFFFRGSDLCVAQIDPHAFRWPPATMRCFDTRHRVWSTPTRWDPPAPQPVATGGGHPCLYVDYVSVPGIPTSPGDACGPFPQDDVVAVLPGPVVVLYGAGSTFTAVTAAGQCTVPPSELRRLLRRSPGTSLLGVDLALEAGVIRPVGRAGRTWSLPPPVSGAGWETTLVSPDQTMIAGVLLASQTGARTLWLLRVRRRTPSRAPRPWSSAWSGDIGKIPCSASSRGPRTPASTSARRPNVRSWSSL